MSLPVTTKFRPRPVAARWVRRWKHQRLDPPTEAEKRDAIEILQGGPDRLDEPHLDPLYAEAERIFVEAGQ